MQEAQFAVTTDKSAYLAGQFASSSDLDAAEQASQDDFIETRFGRVQVRRDKPVVFPKGMLGIPGRCHYALLEFPLKKFADFKLLQSLEDDDLSFITLPLDVDNPIIDRADLENACKELGFPLEDTAILLVVSVHREMENVRLSANARAPLFVNAPRRLAEQYVLHNNKYLVRHMITG